MLRQASVTLSAILVLASGCTPVVVTERNAFVPFNDLFGAPDQGDPDETGQGGGVAAEARFRRSMTVNFVNNHVDADLTTSFVAWVDISSIRDADQQDALLRDGYVPLTREVRLGTVFTLPPGTFVFNGSGVAGATRIRLGPTLAASAIPFTESISLLTPDVVLVLVQPPTSCESVAFVYSRDGEVVFDDDGFLNLRTFAEGGFKTLAQIDAYQCDPLRPGVFLKRGGGGRQPNEFFEGEDVTFNFFEFPDANGDFAIVTVQGP